VAARAARRLAERDGRPTRVLREPRPGEAEEIQDEVDAGGPVAFTGARAGAADTPADAPAAETAPRSEG